MTTPDTGVTSARPETTQFHVIERQKGVSLIIVCCAIPLALLVAAYVRMSFVYKKMWLFDTVVHENGRHTLLEVIFYFRHFSWELLGKALYSLHMIGIFYFYGKPLPRGGATWAKQIPMKKIVLSCMFVAAIITVSIFMTVNAVGFKEAMMGLGQYRTSEIRPPTFGSHWRNHFLSNIVLFSASSSFVLVYRIACCGGNWTKRRFGSLFPVSAGCFVLLTFLFGFTMDPFETPSYLGHQLREIFGSDLPITMLFSVALLIYLEGRYDSRGMDRAVRKNARRKRVLLHLVCWALPVVLVSSFLILKVLSLDISTEMAKFGGGNGKTVADLFAWHFYEHSLDYVFVASFVSFLYLCTLKIDLRRTRNDDQTSL